MELARLGNGSPSLLRKVSTPALGQPLATLDGLQGFPAGWHSSKARTTAKSSALKSDCRQPGRASQDLSPVSVTQPTPHLLQCGLLLCLPDPSVQTVCTPALKTKARSWAGRAPGEGLVRGRAAGPLEREKASKTRLSLFQCGQW
eukprot:6053899-Amphidinium_carterae.1